MATVNEMSTNNVQDAVSAGNLGWAAELEKLQKGFEDIHKLRMNFATLIAEYEKVLKLLLINAMEKRELDHAKKMIELKAQKEESFAKKRKKAYLDLVEEAAAAENAQIEKRAREEAAIKLKYKKALYNTEDKLAKDLLKKLLKREEERAKRNRESDKAQEKMKANGAVVTAGATEGLSKIGAALKAFKGGDTEGAADALANAKDAFKSAGAALGDTLNLAGKELGDALSDSAGKALNALSNMGAAAVKSSMGLLQGTQSKISARLLLSGEFFELINSKMQTILAASPFVKYTDMLNKVETLVDKGVAYNIELRAFLASISDKIATTFDAFDSNLLLIIRIQQEDSTKLRLGMEASLTKFLNSRYQDTSYLSGAHDEVTRALTASIVQLGTKGGAEFEFAVLKWLGSLSALGMDDTTLTGLAGALEALSTGDVETLAGSQYLNLLVMAANQSGMSYSDILTHGLNAESVNSLLSNIVAYWSGIANQSNQVVKKKYAELFGLSMTDMTAIRNVTSRDMDKIFNKNLSYSGMSWELAGLMAAIPFRMAISEMLMNVWDNVQTGIGMNIAKSPGMAAAWLVNDLIKGATGGINIPAITAMVMGTGTGLDINTDVNSLIQLGMVGISTLGLMGRVIGGLAGLGGLNLGAWGAQNTTRHGLGLGSIVSGVTASTSQTTFIGNSDSSSMYQSTLNKAYNDERVTEVKALADESASKLQDQMNNIESDLHLIYLILANVSTGNALRVYVEDYGLTSTFGGS